MNYSITAILFTIILFLNMTSFLRRYAPFSVLTFALFHKNNFSTTTCATATKTTPYTKLKVKLKEIECLNGIRGLVGWDEMVLMKSGSSDARNQQKAVLAAVIYEKETSPELGDLIESLESQCDNNVENNYDRAVIREAKRDYNFSKLKSSFSVTIIICIF